MCLADFDNNLYLTTAPLVAADKGFKSYHWVMPRLGIFYQLACYFLQSQILIDLNNVEPFYYLLNSVLSKETSHFIGPLAEIVNMRGNVGNWK